jgi:methyl-accepting chemotaxis protein
MAVLPAIAKFPRLPWWPGWPRRQVAALAGARRPRLWHIPPKRVVAWSAISAAPMTVVILVGAYLSYNLHTEIAIGRERIEQTHQVLETLNQLFISLQDAETGQRGFIITGQDGYLAPYVEAVTALAPTLARLRDLTAESTTQSIRIARLETLVDAKLAELGRTIVLRRASGFRTAASDVAGGTGKELMDDVRREVALVGTAERTLLRARQAVAQEREREVIRVGLLIALVSVATRVGLAMLLVRLRKRRAAANLRAALAAAKQMGKS